MGQFSATATRLRIARILESTDSVPGQPVSGAPLPAARIERGDHALDGDLHLTGCGRGGSGRGISLTQAEVGAILAAMLPLRARVINGRLVLNEPTTLPEGAEIELAFVEDDLDDVERARLHEALDAADDELRAGKWISGTQLVAALRRGEV